MIQIGMESKTREPGFSVRWSVAVSLLTILAVFVMYWQTTGSDFIFIDDNFNVFENPRVTPGWDRDNALWFLQNIQHSLW